MRREEPAAPDAGIEGERAHPAGGARDSGRPSGLHEKVGSQVRIGISGWRYEPWRGVFYPRGLAHKRELAAWFRDTPDDFVFAVKGSRFITHMKRLRDIEKPLANFFAQGLFELGAKIGPLLWQFPPSFRYEPKRLEAYLRLHGDIEIYKSGYSEAALDQWAGRIRAWSRGTELPSAKKIAALAPPRRKSRDVHCYFDNDMKVKAPFDALRLIEKLGL